MKTFNTFLLEKKAEAEELDKEERFKELDCTIEDDLTDEEIQYCRTQRFLKFMKAFTIVNN